MESVTLLSPLFHLVALQRVLHVDSREMDVILSQSVKISINF